MAEKNHKMQSNVFKFKKCTNGYKCLKKSSYKLSGKEI